MESKQSEYYEQFMQTQIKIIKTQTQKFAENMYLFEKNAFKNRIENLRNIFDEELKFAPLVGRAINIGYVKPNEVEIQFIEGYYNLHVKNVEECNNEEDINVSQSPKSYKIHFSSEQEICNLMQSLSKKLELLNSMYFKNPVD